jgi:hypothetical protein
MKKRAKIKCNLCKRLVQSCGHMCAPKEGQPQERLAECPFCETHHEPHCPAAAGKSLTLTTSLKLTGYYVRNNSEGPGIQAGRGTRTLLLDEDLVPPGAFTSGRGIWEITVKFTTSPPKR